MGQFVDVLEKVFFNPNEISAFKEKQIIFNNNNNNNNTSVFLS
jgi:hypothetical protein